MSNLGKSREGTAMNKGVTITLPSNYDYADTHQIQFANAGLLLGFKAHTD